MRERLKAGDILIIICVLLVAVSVFTAFFVLSFSSKDAVLTVSSDGLEKSYPISENAEFTVESRGYTLKVVIENGSVRVESSDCPDKVCVHTPSVSRTGQMIACVPAAVTLRISGEEAENDFVAG